MCTEYYSIGNTDWYRISTALNSLADRMILCFALLAPPFNVVTNFMFRFSEKLPVGYVSDEVPRFHVLVDHQQ